MTRGEKMQGVCDQMQLRRAAGLSPLSFLTRNSRLELM
jgi:hypothetical protein